MKGLAFNESHHKLSLTCHLYHYAIIEKIRDIATANSIKFSEMHNLG